MARVPRYEMPKYAVFHVTARGAGKLPIYRDRDDRLLFLALFLDAAQRCAWMTHALCLMTNHYHLVVESALAGLSVGMQRVNGIYAQTFNEKYLRWGHLFGERFWCRSVDEDDLADTCLYVVANPVRAGLCERVSDWPWSACRYELG